MASEAERVNPEQSFLSSVLAEFGATPELETRCILKGSVRTFHLTLPAQAEMIRARAAAAGIRLDRPSAMKKVADVPQAPAPPRQEKVPTASRRYSAPAKRWEPTQPPVRHVARRSTPRPVRPGTNITVERWDENVLRFVLDSVSPERYRELWRLGLLKHQMLGAKKPEHLPMPEDT